MIPSLERRYGHRGVAHLRVAVMEVLYSAKKKGECIGAAEISRRGGIFRKPGYATKQGSDHIVWGILNSLVKDNLVTKCIQANGKNRWELTDDAYEKRDAQVSEVPVWGGDKRIISLYRRQAMELLPRMPISIARASRC